MAQEGHALSGQLQDAVDQPLSAQQVEASTSSSSSSDSSSANALEMSLRNFPGPGAFSLPAASQAVQIPGTATPPAFSSQGATANTDSATATTPRQGSTGTRPPLPPGRATSKEGVELNVVRAGSSRKPSLNAPLPATSVPPLRLEATRSMENASSSVSSLATLYGEVFEAATRAMRGAGCHAGQLPPLDDEDARWRAKARAVTQRERERAQQSTHPLPSPHAPYFTTEPSAGSYHNGAPVTSVSPHADTSRTSSAAALLAAQQQQQQAVYGQGGYLSPTAAITGGYGSRGRSTSQLQVYEQLVNMVPAEHAGELPPSDTRRPIPRTQSQRLPPPSKLPSSHLPSSTAITPRQLARPQSASMHDPALLASLPVQAPELQQVVGNSLDPGVHMPAGLLATDLTAPQPPLAPLSGPDVRLGGADTLKHSSSNIHLQSTASGQLGAGKADGSTHSGPTAATVTTVLPGPVDAIPAPAVGQPPATHLQPPLPGHDLTAEDLLPDQQETAGGRVPSAPSMTRDGYFWYDERDKQSSGHYNFDAADQLDALGLFAGADEDDDDDRQHDFQKAFAKDSRWYKLRYWRIFMVAQAIALLLLVIGVILQSQVQTRVEGNVEVYRWMYFLAASPTIWVIIDVTLHYAFMWLEWFFFRESLMYLRNVQRNTCTFVFVVLLMPWYKTIFQWLWCEDERCEADTYASVVDALWRVLLCAMLFTLANLIKCVVAKMLSTHFYRSAHYAKLQAALEKEVYLQMLSRPKRKVVQKKGSPAGGGTTEQSPHAGAGPAAAGGLAADTAAAAPGRAPTPGLGRSSNSLIRRTFAAGTDAAGAVGGVAGGAEVQGGLQHTGSLLHSTHGSHGKLSTCSLPLIQPPVDPQQIVEKKLNKMSVAMMGVSLSHYQPPQDVNLVPWPHMPQYHIVAGLPAHVSPTGTGPDAVGYGAGLDPVHSGVVSLDGGQQLGAVSSFGPLPTPSGTVQGRHRRSFTHGEGVAGLHPPLDHVHSAHITSAGNGMVVRSGSRPAVGIRGSSSATNIQAVGQHGPGWDAKLVQRHSATAARGPASDGATTNTSVSRGSDSQLPSLHHQAPPSPPNPPPPPPPPLPPELPSDAHLNGGGGGGHEAPDGGTVQEHTITVSVTDPASSHPATINPPQLPAGSGINPTIAPGGTAAVDRPDASTAPGKDGSNSVPEAETNGLRRLLLKPKRRPSVEGGSVGGHKLGGAMEGSTRGGGHMRRSVDGGKHGTAGGAAGEGGGGPGSVVSERARRAGSASQPLGPLAQQIIQAVPLQSTANKDVKDLSETELEKVRTAVVIKTYTAIIRNYSSQTPEDSEREQAAVRAFSRALFNNIKGEEARTYLTMDDFQVFFDNPDHASRAFAFFDLDGDGRVIRKEIRDAVEGIFRERANMADSLRDTDSIVQSLEWAVGAVVHFLFLAFYLLIFGVDIIQGFSTFSATLLAFTFIFGNAVKNMFEAMLFLFVEHPYDVGDNISISNEIYRVKKITLLFTEMVAIDGQRVMYPNTELITTVIINCTRSKTKTEFIKVQVDVGVPPHVVADIMDSMTELCMANSTEFDGEPFVQYREMADPLKVVLMISWTYAFPPDNWKRLVPARNAMFGILQAKLYEHGLKCTIQEVERKTIKQLPGYSRTNIGMMR